MEKMKRLSHISSDGRAQMVDVSAKPVSKRKAVATGKIRLQRKTLDLISKDQIAKGNVFATARIAGIQAAKQTANLDRKSTRLNSSHRCISYAVFCLKKKKK